MYNINLDHNFFPKESCIICGECKASQVIVDIFEEKERKYEQILRLNICSIHLFSLYTYNLLKINQDNFTLREIVNVLTEISTAEKICNNSLQNITKLKEYKTINHFFSKFNLWSCAIVGAGPTLDDVIPILDTIKSKVVIISCMQAVNSLLAYEIKPDFIFSIDSDGLNFAHTKNTEIKDIPCVFDLSVDVRTFLECRENIILAEMVAKQFNPVLDLFESEFEEFGELESGYTIATTMMDFALKAGFENIITFGIDLATREKITHSKGYSLAKLISEPGYEFIEMESISGIKTQTSPAFLAQVQKLSEILEKNNKKVYCTSKIFPKSENIIFVDVEKENLIERFKLNKEKKDVEGVFKDQKTYKIDRNKKIKVLVEIEKGLLKLISEVGECLNHIAKNYLANEEFKRDENLMLEAEKIMINTISEIVKKDPLSDLIDNYIIELNKYMQLTENVTDDVLAYNTRSFKRGFMFLDVFKKKIEILKDFIIDLVKSLD